LLQDLEIRSPFDIYQYGRQIIQNLQEQETKESPHPAVDFSILVKEQGKYEVCRYFLASLQLANNCNVEVQGVVNPNAVFGEDGEPLKFETADSKEVFKNTITLKLLNSSIIQMDDETHLSQFSQSQSMDENEIIPPSLTPPSSKTKIIEVPPTQYTQAQDSIKKKKKNKKY